MLSDQSAQLIADALHDLASAIRERTAAEFGEDETADDTLMEDDE